MPKKRPYHHGNLRDALIRAAIEQVEDDGLETLTIRRVAGRAGVTPGAAYHHFADKKHLLIAAAEVAFAELVAEMSTRIDGIADPVERLVTLGRAYIEYCVAHPEHFRIMVGRHIRELDDLTELAPSGRRALELLAEVSAECSRAIGDRIDPTQLMRASWAQVVGVVTLIVERELGPDLGADDIRTLIDTSLDILRRGILAMAA